MATTTSEQVTVTAPTRSNSTDRVPVQSRSERHSSFNVADFDTVTGREPEWKYTPHRDVSELLQGTLDLSLLGSVFSAPLQAQVSFVSQEEAGFGPVGRPEDRASANAWSQVRDVTRIRLDGQADRPTEFTRIGNDAVPRGAHTVIEAAPGSVGIVVLRGKGVMALTENVEIDVADNANLTFVALQDWSDGTTHLASHFARVGANASLKYISITIGGDIVRVNPSIHLSGDSARVDALGLYCVSAGQHFEQQVYVDHQGPRTKSRVNYKGTLQGAGAHGVWVGDVLIRDTAVGTDTYEQNRNLLLSDGAFVDSVPNLEIATGQIEGAGHASATARFDDEQLFYLQSRGIPEDMARRMVGSGYLAEIIRQIGSPELEQELTERLDALLGASATTTTTTIGKI